MGIDYEKYGTVFRHGNITMVNADCMDILRDLPEKAFDLAIVDPPYGIGEDGGRDRRVISKHIKKGWDIKPKAIYFNALKRVSGDQIIWGGNYFTDNLAESRCWLVWDKKLYNSDFSDCELAWTSFDKGVKIFIHSKNGGSRSVAALNDLIHPTQKPVKLYDWLLHNYAKPTDTILDTHLGSGSSAIGAHYFGCEFLGIELDTDYFDAAVARFKQSVAQQDIFFGVANEA